MEQAEFPLHRAGTDSTGLNGFLVDCLSVIPYFVIPILCDLMIKTQTVYIQFTNLDPELKVKLKYKPYYLFQYSKLHAPY